MNIKERSHKNNGGRERMKMKKIKEVATPRWGGSGRTDWGTRKERVRNITVGKKKGI